MAKDQPWKQYIVAGVANTLGTCLGYITGWTAPVSSKLRSADSSPLGSIPSVEEIALMGSLITIGAIFGPLIAGPMASKVGRKWGLLSACIPMLLGWILVFVAVDMMYLHAARLLWGVAGGIMFTLTPMYCAEIATDDVRGALCSLLQAFITVGYLLVCAIGPYISFHSIAYVGFACVTAFAVVFFFMPETPTYYLLKNDREAAASSLCTLRGRSRADVEIELSRIEVDVKISMERSAQSTTVMDIFRGSNFKALFITCSLMLFQQFSGINAMLFYMIDIFEDSGINLDPAIATIIIGSVQVFASIVTIFIVDRAGRRPLLLVSSCGSAIALFLLGTFFVLAASGSEVVTKISFLPVLSLVLFMLMFCCGLGPLPWAIMGELFSIEVKSIASLISTVFNCLVAFLVTRFFEQMAIALGRHSVFWMFGVFCTISFFFTMFLVPETKGKSFQEIQDMLTGRKSLQAEKLR